MISIYDEVVKMFNAAPKMGGNINHFLEGRGDEGGVVRPRRTRC
jgi:hypothetical protein